MLPRRRDRLICAALAMVVLLTACAAPTSPQAPPLSPPDSEVVPDAELTALPSADLTPVPPSDDDGALIVFAAAVFTNAFGELATAFEARHPGVTVVLNYANSAQLAAQLAGGAVADVFASANEQQMGAAVAAGRIAVPTVTFATNRLTLIVPADNPAGIASFEDLAMPGLRLMMAVPGGPVREYTNLLFEKVAADPAYGVDFRAAVYANIVSEEQNVRQVATKIALGEADAGFVYITDVTPDIADKVRQIEIPEAFHVTATHPIGVVSDAPHPEWARAFVEFILSEAGQAILTRWGFGPAPQG